MPIVGVTVDKEGAPIVRQTVTHKLAIGLGPNTPANTANYPKKLDHIAFLKKNAEGKWIFDSELTEHYKHKCGGPPRSLKIVLFDNDIEKVFPSSMKAYKARGCWCRGDGEKAERRDLGKDGKGWGAFAPYTPCRNGGCPLPEKRECKPMGTLYFSLVDFLKLGSVCKVQTTSWQSVAQIHGALATLQRMTGGVLMGIPITLFMQPDRAVYVQGGEAKTGSKFVWGLEVSAPDVAEMRRQLTDGPREFREIRQLNSGIVIEADEEESDDDTEIAGEFYTEQSADSTQHSATQDAESTNGRVAQPPSAVSIEKLIDEAHAIMTQLVMNKAKRDAELAKNKDRLPAFVEELKQKLAARNQKMQDRPPIEPKETAKSAKAPKQPCNPDPEPPQEEGDGITENDVKEFTQQQPQEQEQSGFEF